MPLVFKIQKALVTFNFTLVLKMRIPDIENFWETQKGTWYHKTFEECGEIRKIKIHMWAVWLLTCSVFLFTTEEMKKR